MKSQIAIENLSTLPQAAWVFVGLPAQDLPRFKNGYLSDGVYTYPYVHEDGGIRVFASVEAEAKILLELVEKDCDHGGFVYHPVISAGLEAIAPKIFLGSKAALPSSIELIQSSQAAQVWRLRSTFTQERITVDIWATVLSNSPTIEYVVHAVYGTTANSGQPQSIVLTEPLTMVSGARIHADFAARNGQVQASYSTASKTWSFRLLNSGTRMHRAVRFETRGALMPIRDAAREQGRPLQGLYLGWDGSWMALGRVPASTSDLRSVVNQARQRYLAQPAGTYHQPRPRTQMPESGTTGEQPDFGAASDLAVSLENPWEIHDALWQCQSYAQRPTANKEPDGSPMKAVNHPKAETMGQRPDLNLGEADRLGWPGINQIAWIPSPDSCYYTTSDDQHRADNFLHATYALTRDPALKAIIEDHIELDKTDVYVKRGMRASPRSVGRLALTRANQVWLGFKDAEASLRAGIKASVDGSYFATLPKDRPVRTLGGYEEAKYGWRNSDGSPIIGWQPWQEAIAIIGIAAAAKALNDVALLDVAKSLAKVVTENGWSPDGSSLLHAYAIRWNSGHQFDRQDWPLNFNSSGEAWNDKLYLSGACDYWTLAASVLIEDAHPTAAVIVSKFPFVRNAAQARWRAL